MFMLVSYQSCHGDGRTVRSSSDLELCPTCPKMGEGECEDCLELVRLLRRAAAGLCLLPAAEPKLGLGLVLIGKEDPAGGQTKRCSRNTSDMEGKHGLGTLGWVGRVMFLCMSSCVSCTCRWRGGS